MSQRLAIHSPARHGHDALLDQRTRHRRITRLLRLHRASADDADLSRTQHPDEYFQNSEIAASDVFSFASLPGGLPVRTWEWGGKTPARSIIPVWLTSGWAFVLLRLFVPAPGRSPCSSEVTSADARLLFLAQRVGVIGCHLFISPLSIRDPL